jgi:hypothetical protein
MKGRTGGAKPFGVREQLEQLVADPKTTSNARASAARTLAEIDGLIGKHQAQPPRDETVSLDALSREELINELARLRAACAATPGFEHVPPAAAVATAPASTPVPRTSPTPMVARPRKAPHAPLTASLRPNHRENWSS